MNAMRTLGILIVSAVLLFNMGSCTSTSPPPSGSTTTTTATTAPPGASPRDQFAAPAAAARSRVNALRARDEARLEKILAPDGDDILSSGDPAADRTDVQRFLSLYDEGHRFETDAGGVNTLIVGRNAWPFP